MNDTAMFDSLGQFWEALCSQLSPDLNISGFQWKTKEINGTRLGMWLIRLNRDPGDDRAVWIPFVRKTIDDTSCYMIQANDLADLEMWHMRESQTDITEEEDED